MKLMLAFLISSLIPAQVRIPGPGGVQSGTGITTLLVNSANNGSLASGSSVTTAIQNISSGNLLVCTVRYADFAITVSSVGDVAATNSFSQAAIFHHNSVDTTAIWYAWNTVSKTSDQITFTLSGSTNSITATCDQFSGVQTSGDPLDATANGTGTSSATSGTFTTSQARELLYAGLESNSGSGSWTAGACGSGTCSLASNLSGIVGVALATEWLFVTTVQTSQTLSATNNAGTEASILAVTFKAQ